MFILCKEAKIDHKWVNNHVKINLTISFSLWKNYIYWEWAKKWTLKTQKSQMAILVLNQCSISAVFPIVRFAGDQKTALTGESLYMQLFSADTTIFFRKLKKKQFDPENMKKLLSKVVHNWPKTFFFFSIANRPKISPNLIFCSIKMVPCATSI